MNVNKKLDRFKQWAGERMGGEAKTNVSDDFQALEAEMSLRFDGMTKLQKSMTGYVKAISKRAEGDDKEKTLAIGHMGTVMVNHGEDFDSHSQYGQCLTMMGRTNERLARIQETYAQAATSTWLEGLERSLAQMKEYQAARKKLENRRLAYDAALAKMQKAKKEDFRVEEELRSQKAKYEETNEDVYRRMQDIQEAEAESVQDLTAFLDAELAHYEKCREALLQLKRDWPAQQAQQPQAGRRPTRPRSNTAHSYQERYEAVEEEPAMPEPRPYIKSQRSVSSYAGSVSESPQDYAPSNGFRPNYGRSTTFEGPTQLRTGSRDDLSPGRPALTRVPSDSLSIRQTRSNLRPVSTYSPQVERGRNYENDSYGTSPTRSSYGRSVSPAPSSYSSMPSRTASSSTLNNGFGASNGGGSVARKGPPPPPPSRAKKPPPPPPPAKRGVIGGGEY